MFKSKYIAGQTIPPYDVAVENLDGAIYRVITSIGLGVYIHITSALLGVGFEDLLKDDIDGKDGDDSLFLPTPEMVAAAAPKDTTDSASEILAATDSLASLDEIERQVIR